jgi:hypothetical protein
MMGCIHAIRVLQMAPYMLLRTSKTNTMAFAKHSNQEVALDSRGRWNFRQNRCLLTQFPLAHLPAPRLAGGLTKGQHTK